MNRDRRAIMPQLGMTSDRLRSAPTIQDTIPQCHACGGVERPFRLVRKGGQWWHVCDLKTDQRVAVCPACGGAPLARDWCCAACRRLDEQLVIGAEDVIHAKDIAGIGTPVGAITADRINRGRRRGH